MANEKIHLSAWAGFGEALLVPIHSEQMANGGVGTSRTELAAVGGVVFQSIYRKKNKWWSIDMAFDHFYVRAREEARARESERERPMNFEMIRRKCEELCADINGNE